MTQQLTINIIYSNCIEDIKHKQFEENWIIHLLCTDGEAHFIYKEEEKTLRKNDCAIIANTNLIKEIRTNSNLKIEFIAATHAFLCNQLPANNYSIGGCIKLYEEPIIELEETDALHLLQDFHHIKDRIGKPHAFYIELMGSLLRTMMYDLFAFHAKKYEMQDATEGTSFVVKSLMRLLESGECRQYRDISHYANKLHVSSKYLSDSVKKTTGKNVTYLIERYTIPILVEFLKDNSLSLNQICDEMNFTSISYFSRYCKKHLGVTPSEYRNSAIKGSLNGMKIK